MSKYKSIVKNYYSIIEKEHDKYHKRTGYGSTEYLDLLSGLKIKAFENCIIAGIFKMDPIQVTLIRSSAIDIEKYGVKHGKFGQNHIQRARTAKAVHNLMLEVRRSEHDKLHSNTL